VSKPDSGDVVPEGSNWSQTGNKIPMTAEKIIRVFSRAKKGKIK